MRYRYRRIVNVIMSGLMFLSSIIAIIPLFIILLYLLSKGLGSLNLGFFTELPRPVGEVGGGMANAIIGTMILIGLACFVGLPVGILGGIYLAEFGKTKISDFVRFTSDILSGTPSIVIGVFIYAMLVLPFRQFSAIAGGVALGIMMVPTVMRTTEEMMKLVPQSLREGSLALGVSYWRTLLSVVLKTARGGIVTGILLAISRIAGETAPLLFTALGNQFWSVNLTNPIAALPLQIFTFAISPYEDWQKQSWAGALVLIFMVLLLNIGSRFFIRSRLGRRR